MVNNKQGPIVKILFIFGIVLLAAALIAWYIPYHNKSVEEEEYELSGGAIDPNLKYSSMGQNREPLGCDRDIFSAWNGEPIKFAKIIKKTMKDPDSYEHIETTCAVNGDYFMVTVKFRGTNSFGGKVINTQSAKLNKMGDVIEILK